MTGGYDDGYVACPCFWGTEPGSYVKKLTEFMPSLSGRRVLDVGCGEGKNAVYLARQGAIVDAIDVSVHAIRNSKALWPELDSNVCWTVGDASQIDFGPASYDVVVAYGYLHCMRSREELFRALAQLKDATTFGGFMVVCAFNDRKQELHAHPGFRPTLVSHADYLSQFSDWMILDSADMDLTETHPHNNIPHTHSMTRLLAKRRS